MSRVKSESFFFKRTKQESRSFFLKRREYNTIPLSEWNWTYLQSFYCSSLSTQSTQCNQGGVSLHHIFWLLLSPLLIQQFNKSAVCSGIAHFASVGLRKMGHICALKLQCRQRWPLETIMNPFFFNTPCVKQTLLATNHVIHFTLVGAKFFHKHCWLLLCCSLAIPFNKLATVSTSHYSIFS